MIPVSVSVSALEIAKEDISKIPKEFAQVLKRGAQQRNIWIEQRKHKLAENSNRVSNLDPLHELYDDAFKQISRRHPRATLSTLAKLRDKQIQLAGQDAPDNQSPYQAATLDPLATTKTAWPVNPALNNSIRKSYPNLLSHPDTYAQSPLGTVDDVETLSRSDMKAALSHTLSVSKFSNPRGS